MKTLFFTLLLLASTLFAATDSDRSYSLLNGRYWNQVSDNGQVKKAFVLGILDGWDFRGSTPGANSPKIDMSIARQSGDNLTKLIDSIYADPQNVSLPIAWVVMGCVVVEHGDATKDAMLVALRSFFEFALSQKNADRLPGVSPVDVLSNLHSH